MSSSGVRWQPRLTREVVLDRAVALADATGLDSVTVRGLAAILGVTPMALYWHFRTKGDLLAGLGDRVLDAVHLPPRTQDWQADLRAALLALAAAMRPHPRLVGLVPDRLLCHPVGRALSETTLSCLAAAGLGAQPAAYLARYALRVVLAAVTPERIGLCGGEAEEHDVATQRLRAALTALPPEEYPALVAHAEALAWCYPSEACVELAVDVFVGGVGRA